MKYKGSGKYPLYLLFFVIFVILFVAQTYDPEKKELGSYSINNVNSSKIYLNILNISKLELTIENIFINVEKRSGISKFGGKIVSEFKLFPALVIGILRIILTKQYFKR